MYRDEQNKENHNAGTRSQKKKALLNAGTRAGRRLCSTPEHVGLKKKTLLNAGARSQKKRAPLYRNKLKLTLP